MRHSWQASLCQVIGTRGGHHQTKQCQLPNNWATDPTAAGSTGSTASDLIATAGQRCTNNQPWCQPLLNSPHITALYIFLKKPAFSVAGIKIFFLRLERGIFISRKHDISPIIYLTYFLKKVISKNKSDAVSLCPHILLFSFRSWAWGCIMDVSSAFSTIFFPLNQHRCSDVPNIVSSFDMSCPVLGPWKIVDHGGLNIPLTDRHWGGFCTRWSCEESMRSCSLWKQKTKKNKKSARWVLWSPRLLFVGLRLLFVEMVGSDNSTIFPVKSTSLVLMSLTCYHHYKSLCGSLLKRKAR